MDITPQDSTTQPISDDQELAKALAGVLPDDPNMPVNGTDSSAMQFEETPAPMPVAPLDESPIVPAETPVLPFYDSPAPSSDLESVKKDAIQELRPLIDHIDLPPEEKFDTYLLLIRSTDDASLIAPAHTAAIGITDEKRKAEALLDIIKEIDYLSKKDQAQL
ncbi:MAG: hypothetical protein JWN28_858 [Candidatus Saccharibacteria bacterium]|nr:hypothetical protein [Candidatus Saccharibacteria bacterium]